MEIANVGAENDLKAVHTPRLVLLKSLFETCRTALAECPPHFPQPGGLQEGMAPPAGLGATCQNQFGLVWEQVPPALEARIEARRPQENLQQPIERVPWLEECKNSYLEGNFELIGLDRIEGWAIDVSCPDQAVELIITDNRRPIGVVLANEPSPDLENKHPHRANHAFSLIIEGGFSTDIHHLIEIRRPVTIPSCQAPRKYCAVRINVLSNYQTGSPRVAP